MLGRGVAIFLIVFARRVRAHLSNERVLSLSDYTAIAATALNIVLLVLAVGSLHVAITTYSDAKRSGEEQTRILAGQAQTLQSSQSALDGVSQTLGKQKDILEKSKQALDLSVVSAVAQQKLLTESVSSSRKQLEILQAQWARELEQADV